MKIIFICGSLEAGRDGVGDYTRRLAGELIMQGHQAAVVALNDPYVKEELDGTQLVDGVILPVLRMPSIMKSAHRFERTKAWIEQLEPEWLSLQFVPYAFHPKGLSLLLYKQFKKLLVKGRRAHIMFHETWIGVENSRDPRRLITSGLQKLIITKMIKSIRPSVIHTQLPKTYADLKNITPLVKKLPLFSNIEVANKAQDPEPGILRVGFFSQVEATEPIVTFLTTLGKNAKDKNIQLELLLMGGEKSRMAKVAKILGEIEHLRNHISITGFLGTQELSRAMQSCSLGITTVPRHALGKSGSVAAFLTHGIPVAAPTIHHFQDPAAIGFFSTAMQSAIMLEPDLCSLKRAGEAAEAAKNEIQVSEITKTFISDLQSL